MQSTQLVLPAHESPRWWDVSVRLDGRRFAYLEAGGDGPEVTQLFVRVHLHRRTPQRRRPTRNDNRVLVRSTNGARHTSHSLIQGLSVCILPSSGSVPVSQPFTISNRTTGCGLLTSRNTAA